MHRIDTIAVSHTGEGGLFADEIGREKSCDFQVLRCRRIARQRKSA
jgi:hypothetical protein